MLRALFEWLNIRLRAWFKPWVAPEPCPDPTVVQQWASLGLGLADALSLGASAEPDFKPSDSDDWTVEKWLRLGQSLSHIHPGL